MKKTLVAIVMGVAMIGCTAQAKPRPTPPRPLTFGQAVNGCMGLINQYDPRFDAFVSDDGTVNFFGTEVARYAFRRCLHEVGHDITAVNR